MIISFYHGRRLEYLSLRYCDISDVGLEKIANELRYREEGEFPHLIGLNLANNCITDAGAKHLADMLHTNRFTIFQIDFSLFKKYFVRFIYSISRLSQIYPESHTDWQQNHRLRSCSHYPRIMHVNLYVNFHIKDTSLIHSRSKV